MFILAPTELAKSRDEDAEEIESQQREGLHLIRSLKLFIGLMSVLMELLVLALVVAVDILKTVHNCLDKHRCQHMAIG